MTSFSTQQSSSSLSLDSLLELFFFFFFDFLDFFFLDFLDFFFFFFSFASTSIASGSLSMSLSNPLSGDLPHTFSQPLKEIISLSVRRCSMNSSPLPPPPPPLLPLPSRSLALPPTSLCS